MCVTPGSPTRRGAPWQERVQVHALVVSYEMALAEITELRRLEWGVMVIDEGHRLKNPSSRLYRVRAWARQARPAACQGSAAFLLLCKPQNTGSAVNKRGAPGGLPQMWLLLSF